MFSNPLRWPNYWPTARAGVAPQGLALPMPLLGNGVIFARPATRQATAADGAPVALSHREFFSCGRCCGAARRDPLMQRSGRPHLWLGRRGGQQCGRIPLIHALRLQLSKDTIENVQGRMDGFKKR